MTIPKFLQIHSLHSYPAALINRDDSGLAKRMPFGDAVRTRISAQCLKRHWRTADDEFAIHQITGGALALRSRNIVERAVMQQLREDAAAQAEVLDAVEREFNVGVYGAKGEQKQGRQPLLLGLPEVEYLRSKAEAVCEAHGDDAQATGTAAKQLFEARRGEGDNFKTFRQQASLSGGIEGALFGRMVTSDPAANIDAAVHVAHAFTVHQEESESDYFSVVDDLQFDDEDAGAAHIGDTELTAGLFYGYVVVDLSGLVSNLEGCLAADWSNADRAMAAAVVEHLTHLIATVSPAAKRGSAAPYSYADLMLVEAGARQPRSLANAFRNPVAPRITNATRALTDHLGRLDAAYGVHESRRLMSVADCDVPAAQRLNLDDLAAWAACVVRDGGAE